MMRFALLLLLALPLVGCESVGLGPAEPVPPPDLSAQMDPPEKLTTCPAGPGRPPPPPPEPPIPRPVEALRDWAYALEKALDERDDALIASEEARRECRRRLGLLREWYEQRKP